MPAFRLLLIFFVTISAVRANVFSWYLKGQSSLALRYNETETLLRFKFDPAPADPHFDILRMVGGENLVWVGPDDHPWHYGQWFSWKYINKVNFWETNPKTGKSAGMTEVSDPTVQISGGIAVIHYNRYYRLNAKAAPVLRDEFTITLRAPDSAEHPVGAVIDWSIKTTALTAVTLDRTPLPGEPGGKRYGGYAGLSWRGAKNLEDVRFTDSEGRRGMFIHREQARWVNALGTIGGETVGLAVMGPSIDFARDTNRPIDSANASSWYIVSTEDHPFWYINPSILQPGPITLEQGASFAHSYRVVLHDGSWTPPRPRENL